MIIKVKKSLQRGGKVKSEKNVEENASSKSINIGFVLWFHSNTWITDGEV